MDKICTLNISSSDDKQDLAYILRGNGYIVEEEYLESNITNIPIGWKLDIFEKHIK